MGVWLDFFLMNRTCTVKVGNSLSAPFTVQSGIPQGTCLGPLLLLVMNCDIETGIRYSHIGAFADDTKLVHGVASADGTQELQTDLNALFSWAEDNNMKFNEDKFVLLRYGVNQDLKESTNYVLPCGQVLEPSTTTRDLGVVMSNLGGFQSHITKLNSECRKIMAMIFRSFKCREPQPMLTLFKLLVQSKIDYCSVLWSPKKLALMRTLEKIQADFTRKLAGMYHDNGNRMDYWERLESLKLNSIERRHERYAVIYVWKILHGLAHNPGLIFQRSERRGMFCKIPEHTGVLREESFMVWGPRVFNAMPKDIRNFSVQGEGKEAVCRFKSALDNVIRNIPDQPNVSSNYSTLMYTLDAAGRKSNSLVNWLK